jgi:23S rRNA pseudouridine1911/1915/1917 synthase
VIAVMDFVLSGFLRQLHPFMPHVTEELWSVFGFNEQGKESKSRSIQFTSPPGAALKSANPDIITEARSKVAKAYETILAGRNLRATSKIPSNKKVRFILRPASGTDGCELSTISRLLNAEELTPEPIPLDVVFEDDHVLVLDKPAGMVTHPGAGRQTGTLAAAALAHAPGLAGVGGPRRPGIVHRLDKGTSGLIVLAKTPRAYDRLTAQLARREVSRRYLCLAHGRVTRPAGVVDAPIGRDPRSRVRMAVAREGRGRRAVTRFRVLERPGDYSYVECRLETGRTHQIRVHLASLGHPIVGDTTYGARRAGLPSDLVAGLHGVALHAAGLGFVHPETGEPVALESPLPHRIGNVLSYLRHIADRPEEARGPKQP